MIWLRSVLVATDFSAPSEAALTYGRALTKTFGATLHLLHVLDNDFLNPMAADPFVVHAAADRQVNDRLTDDDRRTLSARAGVHVSSEPADAIVTYARLNDIDLIVTGTHGRSGMTHLLTGSVAERVVRTANCPVLTVRHPEHEFVQSGEEPMVVLKRILVATDFGEAADAAFTYGRELACAFDATVHVLHVVDNLYTRNLGGEAYLGALPTDAQRSLEDSAHRQLNHLVDDAGAKPGSVKGVLRTSSTAAFEIVGYAKEAEIDLIVMGTHGRGALGHLLMGSVAERVVRIAPCPVLTVRHPEHEFVRPDVVPAAAEA